MSQIRITPRNNQPVRTEGLFEKFIRVTFFGTLWLSFSLVAKTASFVEEAAKTIAEKSKKKAGFTT